MMMLLLRAFTILFAVILECALPAYKKETKFAVNQYGVSCRQ